MSEYFIKDYTGAPFELLGTAHLVALGLVFLLNVLIYINRDSFNEQGKRSARAVMAVLLVVNELAFHVWITLPGNGRSRPCCRCIFAACWYGLARICW